MKSKVILTLMLGFLCASIWAQEPTSEIVKAFSKGDAELLELFLNDEVSLSLVDRKLRVDKKEAIKEVNTFLKDIKIKDFALKHSSLKDESGYVIGSLQTDKERYRVNCFYIKEKDKFFINQIRIDKSND